MHTDKAHNILGTYLHVQDSGRTQVVLAPETFWSELASGKYPHLDQGRLISAFTFSAPWSTWERHPAGEELVMLLSGSATLLLDVNGVEHAVPLTEVGAYVLVPQGVWHTAHTNVPTTMLFLTPGAGTDHKPV
jgi:hypothetical protein